MSLSQAPSTAGVLKQLRVRSCHYTPPMSAPPDLTGRIVVDTRARTISTEFSEVFKGRDISSNIQVAIKRFRYGDASPEVRPILLRTAR